MTIDFWGELLPTQDRVRQGRERLKLWSDARGVGKSRFGCKWLGFKAYMRPGNVVILARQYLDDLYETTIPTWKKAFPEEEYGLKYFGGQVYPKGCFFPSIADGVFSKVLFIGIERGEKYLSNECGAFLIEQGEQVDEQSVVTLDVSMRLAHVPFAEREGLILANPAGYWWGIQRFRDHRDMPDHLKKNYGFYKSPNPQTENKFLLAEDPDYWNRMDSLPEHLRARWKDGSDESFEGMAFPFFDHRKDVGNIAELDRAEVRTWTPFIGIDHGYPGVTVFLLAWYNPRDGRLYFESEYHQKGVLVDRVVRDVRALADREKYPLSRCANWCADHQMKATKNAKGYSIWQEYAEHGFYFTRAIKDIEASVVRANRLFQKQAHGYRGIYVNPACRNLIGQLQTVQFIPDKEDKLSKPRDAVDAFRYALMGIPKPFEMPAETSTHGTWEDWQRAEAEGCAPTVGRATFDRIRHARRLGRSL